MRNITVAVDDETYQRARVKAAELDTSVSRLVRDYLRDLAREESDFERLARQERDLRTRVARFSAGQRLSRDDAHSRHG